MMDYPQTGAMISDIPSSEIMLISVQWWSPWRIYAFIDIPEEDFCDWASFFPVWKYFPICSIHIPGDLGKKNASL